MAWLASPVAGASAARWAPWCRRVLLPKGVAFVSSCGIVAAQLALVSFEHPAPPMAPPPPDIVVSLVPADWAKAPTPAPMATRDHERSAPALPAKTPQASGGAPAAVMSASAPVAEAARSRDASPNAVAAVVAPPSPPAAHVATRARDEDAVIRDYQEQVWKMILARRPAAVRLNGRALVSFHIMGDGVPCDVAISGPSGDPMLDRIAVDTVRRSGPFPRPPAGVSADTRFEIWFQFR